MGRTWVVVAGWFVVGCAHEVLPEPLPPAPPPTPAPAPRPDPAPDPAPGPTPTRTAAQRRGDLSPVAAELAEVRFFAVGPAGDAGGTSQGEKLTRALAREPDAVAMFTRLVVHPNPAARLYAYWALRTLAPRVATQHRLALAADATKVEAMYGCIVRRRSVHELVAAIDRYPKLR